MMAPVPKDTKDKPRDENNMEESDIDSFHNPNLMLQGGESDSSDEDAEDGLVAPGGYSLLPSEPGADPEDSDSEPENQTDNQSDVNLRNEEGKNSSKETINAAVDGPGTSKDGDTPDPDLPEEAEFSDKGSHMMDDGGNPAAREKYPVGKIPSYLHLPSLPRDKDGQLWNQKRPTSVKEPLDQGQESAVLKAMSGFRLPPDSIPAWAKNIPEEQWQNQIQQRIANYKDGGITNSRGKTPPKDMNIEQEQVSTAASPDAHWVADFPE